MKEKILTATGEIYTINFKGKHRPAIILNDSGDSCMVVPLTTSVIKRSSKLYEFKVDDYIELGYSEPFYIDLGDLRVISKDRIIDKVGVINESDVFNIIKHIKFQFSNQINSLQLNRLVEEEVEKSGTTVSKILTESHAKSLDTCFDIFLSHSSLDKNEIAGLVTYLKSLGYSVYVDWIEDPQLNRERVTRKSAQIMRKRMNNSRTLLFAFSKNSHKSVWMPWELGYFDGTAKNVAIMPIERVPFHKKKFKGQEYLNLYGYVEQVELYQGHYDLFVVSHKKDRLSLKMWIESDPRESLKEYDLTS